MFLMDMKRSLCSLRFLIAVSGVALVLVLSTWENLVLYTGLPAEDAPWGIVEMVQYSMIMDKFKILIVFVLGWIYTGSFCNDDAHHYLRPILNRARLGHYTVSRFACNYLSVVCASVAGFWLYLAVACVATGLPTVGIGLDMMEFAYPDIAASHPVLYMGMMGLQLGAMAAACSSAGLLLSAYQPDAFVCIGFSGMVFFIVMSFPLVATPFDIQNLVMMQKVFLWGYEESEAVVYAWGMCLPLCISAVCGWRFYRRMEWRVENGYI